MRNLADPRGSENRMRPPDPGYPIRMNSSGGPSDPMVLNQNECLLVSVEKSGHPIQHDYNKFSFALSFPKTPH